MNIDLPTLGTASAYSIVVLQALSLLRRLIQYWRRRKQAGQPASKGSSASESRFFSAFILAAATALAVMLLLVLNSPQQTPLPTRTLSLIASAIAALIIIAALLLVVGVPAYNAFMDLRQRYEELQKRLEAVETQSREQAVFIEQQFPVQREFSFEEEHYGNSAENKYEAN